MLETEFQKIANEVDASLTIQENTISFTDGSRSPDIVFELALFYKDRKIHISNTIGTVFGARVISKITKPRASLEFEITTRSHFLNLLFRKKDQFIIKSQNENLKSFLRHSVGLSELRVIAKNTVFEPMIVGENSKEHLQLITEYHLQFKNWWEVIKPIILFYKEFIDRFGGEM